MYAIKYIVNKINATTYHRKKVYTDLGCLVDGLSMNLTFMSLFFETKDIVLVYRSGRTSRV